MLRTLLSAGAIALLSIPFALTSNAGAPVPVDIELVLAVDVSGSVNSAEQELERSGLVRAFQDQAVIDAISILPRGLAVSVVAFAGAGQTRTVVGWQRLTNSTTSALFAERIAAAFPVEFAQCKMTAIGDAITRSLRELMGNGYRGLAKVDVSGDGQSSEGEDTASARDRALAAGVTINGLVILNEESHLEDYYRKTVIGGPGAFVLTAVDFTSFAEAIRLKLLRELAPAPSADRQEWGVSSAARGA